MRLMLGFESPEMGSIYYDGQALHDLNDFLPDDFLGELIDARDINENGVIAATATHEGVRRAVLLSPVSAIPGDLDNNGAVNVDDLLILLNGWGPCPSKGSCPGDLDGNQQVDVDDLLTMFSKWG